jgi:putative flippase GtrA
MSVAVVIPAYDPDFRLPAFVADLRRTGRFGRIVVVDDGSRAERASIFGPLTMFPDVVVLRHAINLGKGAALKTGLNYVCCACPEAAGAVTADADGQHLAADVVRVADALEAAPACLILGTRTFAGAVPWRSRLGNWLTRNVFWAAVGVRLHDTQSGLRGIPCTLARRMLGLRANGYEFELDMLIQCKHGRVPVVPCPIETVYLEGNRSSHFNPILDSLKIYFVLARFAMASLLTAAVDYVLFLLVFAFTANILLGQAAARLVATGVNFSLARGMVFHSRSGVGRSLAKFVLLVAVMGAVSYAIIQALVRGAGWSVLPAKMTSELMVYAANFLIQRDIIFSDSWKEADAPTTVAHAEPSAAKAA